MVITVVSDVLGAENNGTTVAAMNLIRALKRKGHEVRVLCGDQDRAGQDGFYIVPKLNVGPLNGYVRKIGVSLSWPQRRIVEQALDGAEHVHIMLPFPLGIAAVKEAKRRGLPVTAGFHCQAENILAYIGMIRMRPVGKLVYRVLDRLFYRYVDAIHYPSQFIRDVFEQNIHHATNGYVISNGVRKEVQKRETARPAAYDGQIVILSCGRYSHEKAQDVLLRAIPLSKHRDRIRLILAGQGPREAKYRKLAKRLPIPPVFHLYGRDEICDVLNQCDLYVHPANMELEGIACLEAIRCGKLTIVSDSPLSATRTFAVDARCVFRHDDPQDLARVIDDWIEHPDARAACEKRYLESCAAMDQDACMDAMEQMILEVCHA